MRKNTNFVAPYNHQDNHQKVENTTISATTNNKLSRNNITAENTAATDFSNTETIAEFIKNRYAPRDDGLKNKIYHAWQDKAERYAEALRIDLEASFTKPNGKQYQIRPSWFRIFNESANNKNGKAANVEQAYSLFYDEPNWDKFTDDKKFKFFRAVYHNGVDSFQNKYVFNQIE